MMDEVILFDPTDESQVDLSGIVNAQADSDNAEQTEPEE